MTNDCSHNWLTADKERGTYFCDCGEPLVSMFMPISRNTPAGALLYALRLAPDLTEKEGAA